MIKVSREKEIKVNKNNFKNEEEKWPIPGFESRTSA